MPGKTLCLIAVFCFIAQVACTSQYQWHTVAPETLEELTAEIESSPQHVQRAEIHPVDCREDSCRTVTVISRDYIRLYAPNREPIMVRAFDFFIDDGQVLEVRREHYGSTGRQETARKIMSLDDLAAVQILEVDREPNFNFFQSFLLGVATPFAFIVALKMRPGR